MTKRNESGRGGFTLVEMLVATALILFIMVIISEAFVAGIDSLRQLKALGDMEEKLRVVATQMRRDLSADHFEGRRRLSDPQFWQQPVREGFFRIIQRSPSLPEANDSVGVGSTRATNHRLHFAVKLRGNQQERFFTTPLPDLSSPLVQQPTNFFNQSADGRFQSGPIYNTPWAEVAYFMVRTGTTAGQTTRLYSLYRAQLSVVPDNRKLNWTVDGGTPIPATLANQAAYAGFSTHTQTINGSPYLYFNNPNDLTKALLPGRALQQPLLYQDETDLAGNDHYDSATAIALAAQSNLLLTDVLSFDVQVLKYNLNPPHLDLDFMDLPMSSAVNGPAEFDTATATLTSATGGTHDYLLKAIQITVRIWDLKTEQTRQITIVQDL